MPFIVAALGALVALYFFVIRARGAADMASELMGVAGDVRAAARRFGFTRRRNQHAVEGIDDPNLAIAGVAYAFFQLDDLPSRETHDALKVELAKQFRIGGSEAEEMLILGRWLTNECDSAGAAVSRMSRRLYRLGGTEALEPLLGVIQSTLGRADGHLSDRQREALDDIRVALRVR